MLKRWSVSQYFWICSLNMKGNDGHVIKQVSIIDLHKNPQKISILKADKAEDDCALACPPGELCSRAAASLCRWTQCRGREVESQIVHSAQQLLHLDIVWVWSWLSHTETFPRFFSGLFCVWQMSVNIYNRLSSLRGSPFAGGVSYQEMGRWVLTAKFLG